MLENEIEAYMKVVQEFNDVFACSYEEIKGILQDMVEHRIPLIPRARPVRQKKR